MIYLHIAYKRGGIPRPRCNGLDLGGVRLHSRTLQVFQSTLRGRLKVLSHFKL